MQAKEAAEHRRTQTTSPTPRLSWWLVAGEVTCLGLLSTLAAWLMFSGLPLSVALIVAGGAIFTFPYLRQRLSAGDHSFYLFAACLTLNVVFFVLIRWLGREPFEWLLDWN
jgi:hypothetical protein